LIKILEEKLNNIKLLLANSLSLLTSIDDENFSLNLASATENYNKSEIIKKELLKKHSKSELRNLEKPIVELIKQISEKIDNIIEQKKNESAKISLMLQQIHNKKNLIKYGKS
jgi:hypothetical protein